MAGRWPPSPGRALLALASWAAAAQAQVAYMLQLSGACNYKGELNGLRYDLQGRTSNGSPYYRVQGRSEYLYFDADCSGSGDGTPRWILDDDAPVMGRIIDLDNDRSCRYHARANSFDGSRPPFASHWSMWCGNGWVDRFASFIEITSTSTRTTSTTTRTSTSTTSTKTSTSTSRTSKTSTRTTTSKTGTSRTATSTVTTTTATRTSKTATTTATATTTSVTSTKTHTGTGTSSTQTDTTTVSVTTRTTTTTVETLLLEGACNYKGFLNGLRFELQGVTASGSPWYKSSVLDQYLYHDDDCNGGGDSNPSSRWIIDADAPNASLYEDLDADGRCDYHARLDFPSDGHGPPSSAEWRMFCGDGWEGLHLTLRRVGAESSNETAEAPETLYLMGACAERGYLNGLAFNLEGNTARGAPFYKGVEHAHEHYIYWDAACDGDTVHTSPRWILDDNSPNTSLEMDLDDDGACDYVARYNSRDHTQPPADATWRMYCGSEWRSVNLFLTEENPMPTTRTTTRATRAISRAAGGACYPLFLSIVLLAFAFW